MFCSTLNNQMVFLGIRAPNSNGWIIRIIRDAAGLERKNIRQKSSIYIIYIFIGLISSLLYNVIYVYIMSVYMLYIYIHARNCFTF